MVIALWNAAACIPLAYAASNSIDADHLIGDHLPALLSKRDPEGNPGYSTRLMPNRIIQIPPRSQTCLARPILSRGILADATTTPFTPFFSMTSSSATSEPSAG